MHLVIISHFKPEFAEETIQFCAYFKKQLYFPDSRIHFYNLSSFDEGMGIQNFLKGIAKINEPLVIYYGGHGYRNGWGLDDNYEIPYIMVVDALKSHKKPIIFVNDCCFGMALQDYLSQLNCKYMLLGLCPKTLVGYDSLVPATLRNWKKSKPADPKKWVYRRNELTPFALQKCADRLRFGANLDFLCYPRRTR